MPSSNVCWGIEIGAGAVKAIRLERDGAGAKVTDFVVLPHKKVLSTPDLDPIDATRVALGALMSQYGEAMKGATIAMSVPGHSAFARFAKLPPVEAKGVKNLVKFEAVQQIPFPIDQVEWDYQTFASNDSPDIEVGIFAITRERIDERLNLWGEVGLTPDLITLSPVALYNAIAYDLGFTESTPGTIILDIGTTATDLIVAEGGKVWIRTFPLGGHHFTDTLATAFKLNYAKAEKLKREAETSKYKRHILTALKPVLGDLVQDIQRSITYYEDTHPGAKLTRLIGVGSTFKLPGIRKLLTQQLKLEVYRLERFKKIGVEGAGGADFEAATINLGTAYGLALQGLELTPITANLMPVSVIRAAMWKRKTPWFVAAAGLGLLAGGLGFLRPFLDSNAIAAARANAEFTRPIQETITLGQQQKQKWQEASAKPQPGFVAENLRSLLDRRDLVPRLLADLSAMLEAAGRASDGKGPAFELRAFEPEYLPPGTPLAESRQGGGRDSGSGAGDGAEGGGAAGAAGPLGAFRVTLVVDSREQGGRAFVNDTLLAWLRSHAKRKGAPCEFVEIPVADAVVLQEVTEWQPVSASPAGQPAWARPTRGRDGVMPGAGAPAPGGAAPGGGIDQLAPIPERVTPPAREGAITRYRLTWVAQVVDPNASAGAAPGGGTPGEPAAPEEGS